MLLRSVAPMPASAPALAVGRTADRLSMSWLKKTFCAAHMKMAPAKALAKEHQRHPDGDVVGLQDSLGRQPGLLLAKARAETQQELEADPLSAPAADPERRQKADADGHGAGASDHEGGIVAQPRY